MVLLYSLELIHNQELKIEQLSSLEAVVVLMTRLLTMHMVVLAEEHKVVVVVLNLQLTTKVVVEVARFLVMMDLLLVTVLMVAH